MPKRLNMQSIRKRLGKTQRQVANDLRLSNGAVAMYETGARTPRPAIRKVLADYYGVPEDQLFAADQ